MKRIFLLCCLLSFTVLSCKNPEALTDLKSEYAIFNNSKIHYKTYGTRQPALVFVHGFGCDVYSWKNQFKYFANKNQMIFIDLPGYGKSEEMKGEYTLDAFAEAVKTVIDTLHVSHVVLVGHSLGTPVCRRVVQNYPNLNAKLCDVDGVYCFYPSDSTENAAYTTQINAFVNSFADDENYKNRVSGFVGSLFSAATPNDVKEYASKIMPQTPSRVAYSTMKNLVDKRYWDNSVIDVPTLIFCAKNSQIPENYKDVLKQLYSDMEYNEWDVCGHFMMMEEPEKFNKILDKFANSK